MVEANVLVVKEELELAPPWALYGPWKLGVREKEEGEVGVTAE